MSPSPSGRKISRASLLCLLALAGLVYGGLRFRLALVREYNNPAVDGRQYHALAQELRLHGRFAFGPAPEPLTYSRLPGYPLLLAYGIVRRAPVDLDTHTALATRANAVFDVATGLLVAGLALLLGFGRPAALLCMAAVLCCPLLFTLASHALTETLATLLFTLELFLGVLIARTRSANRGILLALLLGLMAGAAQLVRADAVTAAPAVGLAVLLASAPLRRRLLLLGICAATAALVYAPWPLRNLWHFGHPYFAAWQWRSGFEGRPLPVGPLLWARTWATGDRKEYYLDPAFSFGRPIYEAETMYQDRAEQRRVAAVIDRYNREGLTPAVDAEFRSLAVERQRRDPLRSFLGRPLLRLRALFVTVPEKELVMRSSLLDLPRRRPWFQRWDRAVYALAALAALLLLMRRAGRPALLLLGTALAPRCLVLAYTVPIGLSQRHLVEVMPLLLLLGSQGLCAPLAAAFRLASRARPGYEAGNGGHRL